SFLGFLRSGGGGVDLSDGIDHVLEVVQFLVGQVVTGLDLALDLVECCLGLGPQIAESVQLGRQLLRELEQFLVHEPSPFSSSGSRWYVLARRALGPQPDQDSSYASHSRAPPCSAAQDTFASAGFWVTIFIVPPPARRIARLASRGVRYS